MTVAHDSVPDAMLISNAVAELQTLARRFSQPMSVAQSVVTIQVVFVAGTASAWRLIETTRSTVGRRRRMLCFDSLEQIRRSVDERLAWQRADEQFVARHMATPDGFPSVTADWVHSKDFDLIFSAVAGRDSQGDVRNDAEIYRDALLAGYITWRGRLPGNVTHRSSCPNSAIAT